MSNLSELSVNGIQPAIEYAQKLLVIPDEVFESQYCADALRVKHYIGPLFLSQQDGPGADQSAVRHGALSILLAAESAYQLQDTNLLMWSSGHNVKRNLWRRACWRAGLIFSLGYLTSTRVIRSQTDSIAWNPLAQSISEFSQNRFNRIFNSNRLINGAAVSLSLYYRIFNDIPDDEQLHTSIAVADSFSGEPNLDNPIARAMKRAIRRHFLNKQTIMYPYWWVEAINTLFARDTDFRPIDMQARHGGGVNLDLSHIIGTKQDTDLANNTQETSVTNISDSAQSVDNSQQNVEVSDAQRMVTQISTTTLPGTIIPNEQHATERFNFIMSLILNGTWKLNTNMSHVHFVSDASFGERFIFKYPVALKLANEYANLSLDNAALIQLWRQLKLISESEGKQLFEFDVKPQGKEKPIARMPALLLSAKVSSLLKQKLGDSIQPNRDFHLAGTRSITVAEPATFD